MAKIQSIYRYPIKGLTPEPLSRIALAPGQTIPGDRLYAIENGPSGFNPEAPAYLSKTHFLMLMKNERLASLRTSFDQETHTLTIETPTLPAPASKEGAGRSNSEKPVRGKISADLRTAEGRSAIESFFAEFCADELRGPPKILHGGGHSFSDVARKVVSIINLASVAAVKDMVGTPVHPLRFRGNLYVQGWAAFSELDLVGRDLTAGTVRLNAVKRIVRCAATNVDPDTGLRDLEVPRTLMRNLGHADCGIYAEVAESGEIAAGDTIEIV
ncbi:MAG: MOSC domain-containing protein [Xanthobacteraceae bacterium]